MCVAFGSVWVTCVYGEGARGDMRGCLGVCIWGSV